MNDQGLFRFYAGDGSTVAGRKLDPPLFQPFGRLDSPEHYVADKGLRDAVNVALALGQPLLLMGDPGTGKTQLAASLAWELTLPPPLVFNAKTTSTARDLFYRYDALRHFHDAQFRREPTPVESYITYEALGLAVLLSTDRAEAAAVLPDERRASMPTRSVVLVDEIDKAPRDFPNDVLNEIETMAFTVRETGRTFTADKPYRPILVLTSNEEKNLPPAFLRRCVFYHLSFPDPKRLTEIVERRLGLTGSFTPRMLESAIERFVKIRELPLTQKPATAEFLAWLQLLQKLEIDLADLKPGQAEALAITCCVLSKNKDDLAKVKARIVSR